MLVQRGAECPAALFLADPAQFFLVDARGNGTVAAAKRDAGMACDLPGGGDIEIVWMFPDLVCGRGCISHFYSPSIHVPEVAGPLPPVYQREASEHPCQL